MVKPQRFHLTLFNKLRIYKKEKIVCAITQKYGENLVVLALGIRKKKLIFLLRQPLVAISTLLRRWLLANE